MLETIICCAIVYANPVLVVKEVFPLNVSVDISIVVVDVPLYSALTPDVPDEPEVPELPDEPEVPASVLVSNLLVVVFNTTTWSDVLPELIPYTISPLRATNSLLPAIIFEIKGEVSLSHFISLVLYIQSILFQHLYVLLV